MRKVFAVSDYETLSPSQLANSVLYCQECGREHYIPIKKAFSGNNLIFRLPEIIEEVFGKRPQNIGVVYDRQIEAKLEDLFFQLFTTFSYSFTRFPLGKCGILLDSSVDVGNKAAAELPKEIDFLIGVGSGVICDLTKWIATKKKIPFIIMGTAASMNGYTSISATIADNNIKNSIMLDPASAVLLDSNLMSSAPHEMLCAGIGDLLARNVCNADWFLSNILRKTYFCPVPFQILKSSQDNYLSQIELLSNNDSGAINSVSDALLLSGYSMTILNGETSSSSGSEHVISHFFDFQHELFGLPKNLHGTQVGIGTIIMSTAYELLREMNPADFDLCELETKRTSLSALQYEHKQVFGKYGEKFDAVVAKKRIPDDDYSEYIENIIEKWSDMWSLLDQFLLSTDIIRQALESAGGVTKLSGIQRTEQDAIQALLFGSNYRQRYTILDLFWELGLFPALAPVILEQAAVLE